MRVSILGPVDIVRDGETVALRRAKDRAALSVLVARRGSAVPADAMIEALWGAEPPASAGASLQAAVSNVRRALGGRVERTAGGYLLQLDDAELDSAQFETLARDADRALRAGDATGAERLAADALALWRGDAFGTDAGFPIVSAEASRLDELRACTAEVRAEALIELGRHGPASAELEALAEAHPLRERVCLLRMLALYRAGRQADALRAYQEHRVHLVEKLGIEPAPEVRELERRILEQDPSLMETDHVRDGATSVLGTMPSVFTRLIGREDELALVSKLLEDRAVVTITGAGGTGKTRLAVELARRAAAAGDHVWFVPLAGVESADLVSVAVGEAIGVRERPGTTVVGVLEVAISGRDALLVLDNCEQVVEGAAPFVAELVSALPRVRVVATSRAVLGVAGEAVVRLTSLEVPGDEESAEAEIIQYPAVRLLLDRVMDANPTFKLTQSTSAAAAAIARRLDGMPLALELAAARSRALPLEQVAASLDDLTEGELGVKADWSYDLLLAVEQAAFRRLAVFAGGSGLDAATSVVSDDALVPASAVPRLLWSLADQSLLVPGAAGGRARYAMLEPLREYALGKLAAAGEEDDARRRHLRWAISLAQHGQAAIGRAGEVDALVALDAETKNLRAALGYAFSSTATAADGAWLALALAPYWSARGWFREGLLWCRQALAVAVSDTDRFAAQSRIGSYLAQLGQLDEAQSLLESLLDESVPDDVRASAAQSLATAQLFAGRPEQARTSSETALTLAEGLGDEERVLYAISSLGVCDRFVADYGSAEDRFRQAAELARSRGDGRHLGLSLANLGAVAGAQGRPAEARGLLDEAIEVLRPLRAQHLLAAAHGTLGNQLVALDDLPAAEEAYAAAADLARGEGDSHNLLVSSLNAANVRHLRGRHGEALDSFRKLLETARAHGAAWIEHHALDGIGTVRQALGDAAGALEAHLAALRMRVASNNTRGVVDSIEAAGGCLVELGRVEAGVRLMAAASARREDLSIARDPGPQAEFEARVAALRQTLGQRFKQVWAEGAAVDLDAAADEALALT